MDIHYWNYEASSVIAGFVPLDTHYNYVVTLKDK